MRDPLTDPDLIERYLSDASNTRGRAEAVHRPRNVEEVAEVVAHCQQRGIPLTVSAARTSTTGAPVPHGGHVLSTEHLGGIQRIDREEAVAGPGLRLGELQAQVAREGRMFPPDPTSRHDCTLGGAVACNASGARSFRYGPTRPWVRGAEVVLPSGRVLMVRRGDPVPADWPAIRWQEPRVKTAAGYAPPRDLLDLFIGQEGTLGVLTRLHLRLCDLPEEVLGILACFPDRRSAVRFMRVARRAARQDPQGPLAPRCIEYFDAHCLSYVRERLGELPEGARAALFCEQECTQAGHLEAWWEALEAQGALAEHTVVAADAAGRRRLHALRHAVPAGINEQVVRHGMPKVGTDLAVPDAALDEMFELYESAELPHALFGHLGDNHLHLNLLPRDADELERARAFYRRLACRAIARGGTVSAEHGIGKLKRSLLAEMVGPEVLEQFRALKRHLDPAWILGRGTMLEAAVEGSADPAPEQARLG